MLQSHIPKYRLVFIIVTTVSIWISRPVIAQTEEVLLAFRYPSVGHVYVNSLYDSKTNQAFLPVIELFNLLEINGQPDVASYSITGNYLKADNPYMINWSTKQGKLGNLSFNLNADECRVGELDLFISPRVFKEIFQLDFTVNIKQLVLELETPYTLPVQERKARELARSKMDEQKILKENYPLAYDRKRSFFTGTMIDYNISGNYSEEGRDINCNLTGGMEVLGGDIQGTVYGLQSSNGENVWKSSNVRWRYAFLNNSYLSGISAGQLITTGLQPLSFNGITVTNDPIEPRRMYETFVVDGNTEPESEVELYLNERLCDYKRADELGYYRFDVPMTYGTTRIGLRIYTPSGEIITNEKQMQVPFTFLPKGVVTYHLQAGETNQSLTSDTLMGTKVSHGDLAIGINRWLTASAGAQHQGLDFIPDQPFYYGSIAARLARQYLTSLDIAPGYFYRITGNVLYSSNMNFNFLYTRYDGESIFNARKASHEFSGGIYLPFNFLGISSGLRLGNDFVSINETNLNQYRIDLNSRIGKINLRFNYRDNYITTQNVSSFGRGLLTTTLTYNLSRSPGLPVYFRGVFVRVQSEMEVRSKTWQNSGVQLSKTIMRNGRLNLMAGYNHVTREWDSQVSLILDLKRVRSTTLVASSKNNVNTRQSISGNLGWDMPNKKMVLNNRQQTGRGAAAVKLFVDNNNSGAYDRGDQLLADKAVRLDRTAVMEIGRDSILRVNQLQSYFIYNLRVNRNAVSDPTLVPLKNEFSFIVDPNQYKQIEIPFYRGGTIEGSVQIEKSGISTGQGGLRIILKGKDSPFEMTLRTFADGEFYTNDLPPGKYSLMVDVNQMKFLKMKQKELVEFEIKALSSGDYIENIKIILVPETSGTGLDNR